MKYTDKIRFIVLFSLFLIQGCGYKLGGLEVTGEGPSKTALISINSSQSLRQSFVNSGFTVVSQNYNYQILIQGNTGLTSCCAFIQFNTAIELGSVLNLAISNNGAFCDDENSVMLECLGFIEGCTDTVALNFNELASVDDGSCAYFCPESVNDMQDYSCKDQSSTF